MKHILEKFTLLAGCLFLCSLTLAADPERPGYSCLFIGHSFFIPVAKQFAHMPKQCGIINHKQQIVFSGGKSGSPGLLWKNSKKRLAIQKILASGKIELLGMTSYDATNSSFDDYKRWIDYALKHNNKTKFFIAMPWGKNGASRKLDEYREKNRLGSEFVHKTVVELRKHYPNNTFFYLNYGIASVELKKLFESGNLADVNKMVGKSDATIYLDSMGHASTILTDLSALLWVKTLYGADLARINLKRDYIVDLKKIAASIFSTEKQAQQVSADNG